MRSLSPAETLRPPLVFCLPPANYTDLPRRLTTSRLGGGGVRCAVAAAVGAERS